MDAVLMKRSGITEWAVTIVHNHWLYSAPERKLKSLILPLCIKPMCLPLCQLGSILVRESHGSVHLGQERTSGCYHVGQIKREGEAAFLVQESVTWQSLPCPENGRRSCAFLTLGICALVPRC